ncbi:Uncharacterised protein [Legionella pneumophila]|nr:Uncharacterised protein [Legionella pneumophila]CZH30890.1 Uncharacterised protein [Legionella pneumophila]
MTIVKPKTNFLQKIPFLTICLTLNTTLPIGDKQDANY